MEGGEERELLAATKLSCEAKVQKQAAEHIKAG